MIKPKDYNTPWFTDMKLFWSLALLVLAWSVRLYHLDTQSLWWDEGHSLFVAQHALLDIPTLPAMDVHPPAYFWLLHLWQTYVGSQVFMLRYLSVIFSMLTVALLMRWADSLTKPLAFTPMLPPRIVVGVIAALSPLGVAYAQEVRSYAMFTCLVVGSTWALWRSLSTARFRWGYVLLTAACLYTHYFSIFLLLFQNIAAVLWGIGRGGHTRLGTWLLSQLAILALFAPQLRWAARQVSDYANPNLHPPTLGEFLSRSWQAYTMGLTIDPTVATKGMGLLAGVLILSLVVGLSAQPRPTVFLVLWVGVPLAAYFAVLQVRPSFEPRYLMLITPAIFLLWGIIPSRHGQSIVLVLTTISFSYGLHSYYTDETYFKADAQGVTQWLAAETTAHDVVLVDVPHPFHYYAAQIPAPMRYLFVDIHTAADTLTREAQGRDRLFWVTWAGSDTDPRQVIPFLAQKQGARLGQQEFRGYRVQWFSLSGQPFSLPLVLSPLEAQFGETLRLEQAASGWTGQHQAWATLQFKLLQATAINYKVSLRLRTMTGETVAQVDQELLNDRHFRTSAWPVTDPALNQAINVYLLPPVTSFAPPYRLEAVVYQADPPYSSEGVFGAAASADNAAAILGELK